MKKESVGISHSFLPKFLLAAVFSIVAFFVLYPRLQNASAEPAVSIPPNASYEQLWNQIDSLADSALYRSAKEVADFVLEKARKEKQDVQLIKALVCRYKMMAQYEEESAEKAIYDAEAELKGLKFPARQFLHSMLAEMYWNYYEDHRWTFYSRSQTTESVSDSINTWDIVRLTNQTMKHYRASIENTDSLKKIPLTKFGELITKEETHNLRPTLYDFLVHRAISFYSSEEPSVSRPAERFTLSNPNYYGPLKVFNNLNEELPAGDTFALRYYAFKTYQQLLAFRLRDTAESALIDADRLRLNFIHQNYTGENSDELYRNSLRRLAKTKPRNPESGHVLFDLAQHLYSLGTSYDYLSESRKENRLDEALLVCDSIIAAYPKTQAAENAAELRRDILQKEISFVTEEVIMPGKAFPALLKVKNEDTIYFRIAAVPRDQQFEDEEARVNYYLSQPALLSWTQPFPHYNDHLDHEAQLIVPALASGNYVMLASPDPAFDPKQEKKAVAHEELNVTNIAYLKREGQGDKSEYLFVNRTDGSPLVKAKVGLLRRHYNSAKEQYEYRQEKLLITDKDGRVEIEHPDKEREGYALEVNWKKEYLRTEYQYSYWYDYSEPERAQTFFFLDRKIYRPGQTVFFKGITVDKKKSGSRIVPLHKTVVRLSDPNSQEIRRLELTTNDFGSFSGSFVLPDNGLTGSMSIENESGSVIFSMEEYKRPKFEISFEKLKGQPVLGDSVTVYGKAKSFTGAPLDQATVRYTVKRDQYRYYYWKETANESADAILAQGTLTANDTGGFSFTFRARAGEKDESPYYSGTNFNVNVDVTDISGETHSDSKTITLDKTGLQISTGMIEEGKYLNNTDSLFIATTNYDDLPVPADVQVVISRLQSPDHIYRSRKWSRGDTVLYTEDFWKKNLPNDLYRDENDREKWKRSAPVFTAKYNTGSKLPLHLAGEESWGPGLYYYECTTADKNGKKISTSGYFERYNKNQKEADSDRPMTLFTSGTQFDPGGKISMRIGSALDDVNLLIEAKSQGKFIYRKWYQPEKKLKEITIPVPADAAGLCYITYTIVYHNRVYSEQSPVWIRSKNDRKNIEIEFETFRDKLTPGQKEEWRVKIKGEKGEKVAAEMVAAMYDASLDEFEANDWYFDPVWFQYDYYLNWQDRLGSSEGSSYYQNPYSWGPDIFWPAYENLKWFGYFDDYYWFRGNVFGTRLLRDGDSTKIGWSGTTGDMIMADSVAVAGSRSGTYLVTVTDANGSSASKDAPKLKTLQFTSPEIADEPIVAGAASALTYSWTASNAARLNAVKARKNLGETVFFYPHLMTDSSGTIIISFTMNEALSKWKLMTFAHTKDLRYDMELREIVTQKELMVTPNAPRFFREGDQISFTARVANLSEQDLSGTAQLMLFDALTMKPVDEKFGNVNAQQNFKTAKGKGAALSWNLRIPDGIGAVTYRVVATAGNFSDGEENAVPVLSNRMLVTETLPLSIMGKQTKDFRFEKLISQNGGSKTLRNEKLTLEFTSNPAWYAVQSLPYMMEYPYECAEQTFNRFYSNSLAATIANSSPKLRAVFDAWKNQSPDAFLSNLEKNPELKQLMLTETPWVLEAKDESERKRRVGLLFDANRMADETGKAMSKLKLMQYENGAWPWFENMPEDRYITQYIVCGFGRLGKLGAASENQDEYNNMIQNAVNWMDEQARKDYNNILKNDKANKDKDHLGYLQIQYLYARSYFPEMEFSGNDKAAFNYYLGQMKKYWVGKGRYMEGMSALALFRFGETVTAGSIMKSLGETALHSKEFGMYWKENTGGWYWHQASIETQSLLIEAFKELKHDTAAVDEMRIWLLKNKQMNDWKTTKATADACYALLLDGTSWLATESDVTIVVGSQTLDLKQSDVKEEAGTGYFKTAWKGAEIKPEMGNVKLTKTGPGVSWGAMYWQYFEEMDKITPAQSPLKVSRKLFLQKKTASGIVLEPVTAATVLHPGDQLKVRIELKNDRDMEYVHLKDMRASGFEPVNVFSQYKYQDGLSYYESTKDASTDFFFSYLPKGAHVFEYPLTVIHAGDFSMGIASAECMYAPEFAAHSEGQRVLVK